MNEFMQSTLQIQMPVYMYVLLGLITFSFLLNLLSRDERLTMPIKWALVGTALFVLLCVAIILLIYGSITAKIFTVVATIYLTTGLYRELKEDKA